MPNHITNRLTITGTPKQVKAVKDFLKDKYEDGTPRPVDFNKLVPMPAILSQAGGIESRIVDAAKKACNAPIDGIPLLVAMERASRERAPERFDEPERQAQFEQCCQAYRETGFVYWYDWCVANWGTKWNAYDMPKRMPAPNVLQFNTAWSGVPDLIEKLGTLFSDVRFYYEWADEDTGSNTGKMIIESGLAYVREIENQSREAYELSFKLRPESRKYYQTNGDTYAYVDND